LNIPRKDVKAKPQSENTTKYVTKRNSKAILSTSALCTKKNMNSDSCGRKMCYIRT